MLFETILQELITQLLPQLIPELQLLPHLPAYLLAILPLISAFHESKLGRKKCEIRMTAGLTAGEDR